MIYGRFEELEYLGGITFEEEWVYGIVHGNAHNNSWYSNRMQ